jgi:hypothetical protein
LVFGVSGAAPWTEGRERAGEDRQPLAESLRPSGASLNACSRKALAFLCNRSAINAV